MEIRDQKNKMMEKGKIVFNGVLWTVILNVVNVLYGIVSVPFLISYFGKEEYGLIGLALSVNVYTQLLDMGMTNSNVKFFAEYIAAKDKQKTRRLFSLTQAFYLSIGILNSSILFILAFTCQHIFNVTEEQTLILRNLLLILALNSTFSWISVCYDQFIRANDLIDWIKKRTALLKILQFVLLFATIVFKFPIEIYFCGYIFMATVILPLSIRKAKRIAPYLNFRFRFDIQLLKEIYPYALGIFSFSIFQFLAYNFRPLFLGGMIGPEAVAEFNVMNTIASVVVIVSSSFLQVFLPLITKMKVNNQNKEIENMMLNGTKFACILVSALVFLLILSVDEIFTVYVGDEYTSLSWWMSIWLLTFLMSHRNVMASLVFTQRRIKSVAWMGLFAMIASIMCYGMLIPLCGIGGVIVGFTIHELIHTLFYYTYFLPRKFDLSTWRIFKKSVLPSWLYFGGACVLLSIVFRYLSLPPWGLLLCKSGAYVCIILVASWCILLNHDERIAVKTILIKK